MAAPIAQPPANRPELRFIKNRMEDLHVAYVKGVAAGAGCIFEVTVQDENGIDGTLIRSNTPGQEESVIKAQLKSRFASHDPLSPPASFQFAFKKRQQFERLAISTPIINSILLFMPLPRRILDWVAATHVELSLRHCCYWDNIAGQTSNLKHPNVAIPASKIFDPQSLTAMFDRVKAGGRP